MSMVTLKRIPMTKFGVQQLEQELHHLKNFKRLHIIHEIAKAREHGDLKENSEYHAAKEEQARNEFRISDLENKLSWAEVIDVSQIVNHGKVIFGATIHLLNLTTHETVRYQIVGEDEADIKQGKISVNSPIARALIGKGLGDCAEVRTPAGLVEFEIDQVEYI